MSTVSKYAFYHVEIPILVTISQSLSLRLHSLSLSLCYILCLRSLSLSLSISVSPEVSVRIIGAGEHDINDRETSLLQPRDGAAQPQSELSIQPSLSIYDDSRTDRGGVTAAAAGDAVSQSGTATVDGEPAEAVSGNGRDSSYQRYDIQQATRWIKQVLPFSLLLLVVFIRQHLQVTGFFVSLWIVVVMFKSNVILRKQTALKGERKVSVLIGMSIGFLVHVVGVYWWYQNDDLLYPLIMLPPSIPPFWHPIFIIMVNDTLVRKAAMVVKCFLLMYHKNSRGRNYRKQGQMITSVEYLMLLYRALLPTPVWYRFFLDKEYGSLFSSLMIGLYLTFKLTSVVEKMQSFFAAVKALSRKEVRYGAYATSEQVEGIFSCSIYVSRFERERTCPLCRALVKPTDLRSFGDGSTSLFFQLF
ncbi:LOW QUALITY PROTEIN: hypothetical protein CFOL_v3_18151 [Cephalotus follicularis]|uniref:Uncharacterized protein n=1 Tax=Cephalotus follicularis TaxID=3775 RepID=A0A1Q3C358_CEPFO|nr:LOW QUALITY PROTEIN: hypothetical protein CFOL_v3_18150 [Cephalotus follicularis]GAV74671.1 LOW QUALITY PROTEIN: hypothetical protein CFOL_v3_18151 [Cephalotus follicularis]